MAESMMRIVESEVKRVIMDYNDSNSKKIPFVEVEIFSKYLNKVVVTFLNKHLIFCKRLEDDLFFIKGYKNVTLAELTKSSLSQRYFIRNEFKNVFFGDVMEKDILYNYSISDGKYVFNNIDKVRIAEFIGIFRNELIIEALDWFFFELPEFLIENYSGSDFKFK